MIRSDNGIEFCSNTFKDYFRKEGILIYHIIPYTSQQNGVAEHMNMTIIFRARCILSNVCMHKYFWDQASSTAC